MKRILVMLLCMVTTASAGLWYVCLPSQQISDLPPSWVENISNPTLAQAYPYGWRSLTNRAVAPAGYRMDGSTFAQSTNNQLEAVEIPNLVNLGDEAAAQSAAASNAAYAATLPSMFPNGIEGPKVILTSQTNGLGVAIGALDSGGTYTWIAHASPYSAAQDESNRLAEFRIITNLIAEINLTTQQIAAVRNWYTNSPANVFPSMSASQKAWLGVNWQVLRYFAKKELKVVR